jgi:hypothetical protein
LRLVWYAEHGVDTLLVSEPKRFCNAASNKTLGLDFTHVADVHDAYRQYLLARWAIADTRPTWREAAPDWTALFSR